MDIESKIKELEKQRDEFVVEVNKQIAFINGQISILVELQKEKSEQLVEKQ